MSPVTMRDMTRAAPALKAALAASVAGYCVVFVVAVASVSTTPRLFSSEHVRWVLLCIASGLAVGLGAIALHACRPRERPRPGFVPAMMALIAASLLSLVRLPSDILVPLYIASTLAMAAVIYDGVAYALLAAVSAVIVTSGLLLQGEAALAVTGLVVAALLGAGRVAIGRLSGEVRIQSQMVDQARWAATEFAQANLRLQDSISRSEIHSRSSERTRIAREVHDTVGHALTAVLVQISTALELLRVRPEGAAALLTEIEQNIRDALEQTRRAVQGLRDESVRLSWQARWRQLCLSFAECTGARVVLNVPDGLESVEDKLGEAVFRIIQESLTNSIRHGRATLIDIGIKLKQDGGQLLLRVSDNGRGASGVVVGSGLAGIRERAAGLGGEAAWQTLPDKGFDLGVVLPWQTERPAGESAS
jgi:signal transduction histidine kinase